MFLSTAEFSYNSAKTEGLRISPFEVYLGWKPTSPLYLLHGEQEYIESVNHLRQRLISSFLDAHFAQQKAQINTVKYMSKKMLQHQYKIGHQVWLDARYVSDPDKSRTKSKLNAKRFRPFSILDLVGCNAI